jgi:hypothetical protein
VLAVSRSSLNGVDDGERVGDRVIAFVAERSPSAGDLRDRGVADSIVRAEAVESTEAIVDACELSRIARLDFPP